MLKKVTEEKLKTLGFKETSLGNYRKDYPSNGESGMTEFMYMVVQEYWFNNITEYTYAIESGNENLWVDDLKIKLNEKDDPEKMCEAIKKGFAEWKKDLKELRKRK